MNRRNLCKDGVLKLACTLLLPLSAVQSGMAAQGTVAADTYISSGSNSGANFGTAVNLDVGGGSSALVRFDLSGIPLATSPSSIGASLTLFANKVAIAGGVDIIF